MVHRRAPNGNTVVVIPGARQRPAGRANTNVVVHPGLYCAPGVRPPAREYDNAVRWQRTVDDRPWHMGEQLLTLMRCAYREGLESASWCGAEQVPRSESRPPIDGA
jgi:hypothetical protein